MPPTTYQVVMCGIPLNILIVDDNAPFVDSLVAAFKRRGMKVKGCNKPAEIMRWSKREEFNFDLVLLDMRLGVNKQGESLNAAKLLPHLRTYSPLSKVIVFTQKDITVEECVRCIQLGALGIIPKTANLDDLVLIADVYRHIGNQNESQEELIRVLWEMVRNSQGPSKGQYLEMLVINLFNSMPTFRVLDRNILTNAGEIDVLVENTNQHDFWKALNSVHLVIECKNKADAAQIVILNQLKELVATRGKLSTTGVLVSMESVTRGLIRRRNEIKESKQIHIFTLDKDDIQTLVDRRYDQREPYLRDVFSKQ